MRDLDRELDKENGLFPESWRPRPGDKIVGTLKRYDQGESPYGPRWIAVLECKNAGGQPYLCSVWLSHTVLVDQFKKVRPKIGERVGIKRLDDAEAKEGGNGYARYVVRVDRPEEAQGPDWDNIADPQAPEGGDAPF